MFDELKNAVKAQLYEKAISPLSGAFMLSWAAWNYRFILVLISSSSYAEKISYIDKLPISEQTFLYGFFLPLLSASAFIVVYPIPAKFFYEISRKWQKELKEVQQKYDDELPMDQEEARKIRREILQAEIEFDKELKNKEEEISRLREIVEQLQREKDASVSTDKAVSQARYRALRAAKPNDLQHDMLSLIGHAPKGARASALLKTFGDEQEVGRVRAQHGIDELERMNLIEWKPGHVQDQDDILYSITKQGRAYLVDNSNPQAE